MAIPEDPPSPAPSAAQPRLARAAAPAWAWLSGVAAHPATRGAWRRARPVLLALVIGVIAYEFSKVGWAQVAANLPTSPAFYAVFALRYLAAPAAEIPAYGVVWRRPLFGHMAAFLRKRVYNFAVMGYSGEAFLALWAQRRLGLDEATALRGVRDNAILSALASNAATVALVGGLALSGGLAAGLAAVPGARPLFAGATALALTLAVAATVWRRRLTALSGRDWAAVAAIHAARIALVLALSVLLYRVALPAAGLGACLTLVALQLALTRIPFLPNQELAFVAVALQIAPALGAGEEALAGVLAAEAALSTLVNAAVFVATLGEARTGRADAGRRP